MRCAVCGSDGGAPVVLFSGANLGAACPGTECAGLLWESHFVATTEPGDADAAALVLWMWQRRRAQVQGRPFMTPAPKSKAERELDRAIAARGWTETARELE